MTEHDATPIEVVETFLAAFDLATAAKIHDAGAA